VTFFYRLTGNTGQPIRKADSFERLIFYRQTGNTGQPIKKSDILSAQTIGRDFDKEKA